MDVYPSDCGCEPSATEFCEFDPIAAATSPDRCFVIRDTDLVEGRGQYCQQCLVECSFGYDCISAAVGNETAMTDCIVSYNENCRNYCFEECTTTFQPLVPLV